MTSPTREDGAGNPTYSTPRAANSSMQKDNRDRTVTSKIPVIHILGEIMSADSWTHEEDIPCV
jgi:hypothetical protein